MPAYPWAIDRATWPVKITSLPSGGRLPTDKSEAMKRQGFHAQTLNSQDRWRQRGAGERRQSGWGLPAWAADRPRLCETDTADFAEMGGLRENRLHCGGTVLSRTSRRRRNLCSRWRATKQRPHSHRLQRMKKLAEPERAAWHG